MQPLTLQLGLTISAFACALVAVITDLRARRIPNVLTLPFLLLGLMLHFMQGGWRELSSSLAASILCGAVFLIFYLAGGMGAGDVKLIAAQGCLLGLPNAASLLILTALAGGILALGLATAHGKVAHTLRNVFALTMHHSARGLKPHPELNLLNSSTLRLPYALAIAAGVMLTLYLQPAQVLQAAQVLQEAQVHP